MNTTTTTDIWFASFLVIKGEKIASFEIIARGKGKFIFAIDGDKWREYKLEFNNSPFAQMKQVQESLKDLTF